MDLIQNVANAIAPSYSAGFPKPFAILLPYMLAFIFIELLLYPRVTGKRYPFKLSALSLFMGFMFIVSRALTGIVLGVIYLTVWEYRLWTVPLNIYSWIGIFLGVDFLYYWFHRLSHRSEWFWASHVAHHTPEQMTLPVSYQLSWTELLAGIWPAFVVLAFFGFHPGALVFAYSTNLLYQFFLHTVLIRRIPYFEFFFNSPSHHRVHHSRRFRHLDMNYGGIFIIYDRIFGTFVSESDDYPVDYGLVHPHGSLNPIKIALNQWYVLFSNMYRAKGLRAKLRIMTATLPPAPVETHEEATLISQKLKEQSA